MPLGYGFPSGASVIPVITATSVTATTSGTSHTFTGIPSWVKKITVNLYNISLSGTASIILRIGDSGGGDSGGIEATSYDSTVSQIVHASAISATANVTGFDVTVATTAATFHTALGTLSLVDASTNTWLWYSVGHRIADAVMSIASGHKSLSATLDRVQLTTSNGTDTFDSGSFSLLYE